MYNGDDSFNGSCNALLAVTAYRSALFHTKPASHDRKLVQEGLTRALFVPFHAKFWSDKPWFYQTATALYSLHIVAVCIYIFHHKATSAHNSFEVFFPIFLLFLVAIGYGRVSSALQMPDIADPACKILSPAKQVMENVCGAKLDNSALTSGLGSALADFENSDGTDSDEESGNSSSSSEESNPNDDMFPHKSISAPSSPKCVRLLVRTFHVHCRNLHAFLIFVGCITGTTAFSWEATNVIAANVVATTCAIGTGVGT